MSEDKTQETAAEATTDTASGAEALEARLAELEKRNSELQGLVDRTVQENKSEREKKRQAAEAAGEYEKALKIRDEQLAEKERELAEASERLSVLSTLEDKAKRYDEFSEKRRVEILEKIPENVREQFKDDPLESLEKTLILIGDSKPPVHKGGPAKLASGDIESLDGLNSRERAQFAKDHPEKFQALVEKGMKGRSL
jgi:hypothetical protein